MPLYQEWEPNKHALAAIWHIEEPETFFGDKTGLNSHIKHPRKRIEHLCGRFLLRHLRHDFPLHHIAPDEHDKPRIPHNRHYFSISHSYPYVAAIMSDKEECGIDIQVWKHNIGDISHMFLSGQEQALCREDARLLTLAWAAKEAVYKWHGRRKVEFIEDLPIQRIVGEESAYNKVSSVQVDMQCFGVPVSPVSSLHKDFALSYLILQRHL